jgi:TPR repeat protein
MSFILKLTTIFSLCGVALAQNNNAILTFDEAKELADQGDGFGEAVVAFHYSIGWQTEKNHELGVQYAKSSAEKKNPLGLFRLGSLTLSGEGVEKNEELGLALQDEALTGLNEMEGNPYSITALGVVLFQGKVLDKDLATAAKLYKKAADMGYAPAQYNYAKCAESGQGIAKNIAASKMYLQKAEPKI